MFIDANGQKWFKGNLHAHTTNSDGRRAPEDVIKLYADADYDFLALTDHWRYQGMAQKEHMLLLSGCEYDTGSDPRDGIIHIVGIGMARQPELTAVPRPAAQAMIDAINGCGGLAILAHPAWSLNMPEHIRMLRGLAGTEIYNSVSDLPHSARPYSGLVVDQLACQDYLLPCFAADDSHFYDGEETKSYIMVRCESCTPAALMAAIRRGDFYATQGPQIRLEMKEDRLEVTCTPAEHIVFFSNVVYSNHCSSSGHGLTAAVYPFSGPERFIRVEVTDSQDRTAWSSPVRRS
ncbi:MAG TPA: hypothetical protein DD640_00185 [Clostridiales bacterium]|nr:hypothetical protein [Clostridiales bacterium]